MKHYHIVLAAAGFAAAVAGPVGSVSAAIFTETFPGDPDTFQPLSINDWQVHTTVDAQDQSAATNVSLGAVNRFEGPVVDGTSRIHSTFRGDDSLGDNPNPSPIIIWTEKQSLGDFDQLDSFTFFSNNSDTLLNKPQTFLRVAIRAGGEWYASEGFETVNAQLWPQLGLDFQTEDWLELSFTPGVSLQNTVPTTLGTPTGEVDAIGFYVPNNQSTLRLDDLAVTAIPEPTSLAALGLGGLLLNRRRSA
ncbi:MAG: PEP-CTERM sorting domain-containing protein [Phycisphaerae bacterium]